LRLPGSIRAVGLCCLVLGGCIDTATEGPEVYVVRPEDTLYSIAWRHDLDYRDLARWNNLGADFRITIGQALVLGPTGAPTRAAGTPRPVTAPPVAPPLGTARSGAALPGRPPKPATAPAAAENTAGRFVWPTDNLGEPRAVPGGGILLSGRLGQDVRAAGSGRVVYTGSGLRGYGNLIIIKHADSLLSAYAHNRDILVHDGQDVMLGQVIGHMGEDGHQSPVLYFEIRQNGRPVDPMPFLSKVR
jgi:lipoprotein NlpD